MKEFLSGKSSSKRSLDFRRKKLILPPALGQYLFLSVNRAAAGVYRPTAEGAPCSHRTKSLEMAATRVVTGTNHWTVLSCENYLLASAGSLDCGQGVQLGGTVGVGGFSATKCR